MSWWYPSDTDYQMQVPEYLMARGRTHREGEGDFRFGSSMHGEELFMENLFDPPGFLVMFCRTTLPWYYLSRLERERFDEDVLYYSNGVVALIENGKRIIRQGEFVIREDDDLFVPALWNEMEIIAYSSAGYGNREWRLPEQWQSVELVDIYSITHDGLVMIESKRPIVNRRLVLHLERDQAVSILPSE